MVRGRGDRRVLLVLAALCTLTLVAALVARLVRGDGDGSAPDTQQVAVGGGPPTSVEVAGPAQAVPAAAASQVPAQPAAEGEAVTPPPAAAPVVSPGQGAVVDVAVANLWAAPAATRSLDQPSLGKPVDMRGWLSSMAVADRGWLVDRLVTQALYGDRVIVLESAGEWAKVAVARQPSSLDSRGYPGWMPAAQLTTGIAAGGRGDAVVVEPATMLRDPGDAARGLMELSYNTRLPVLDAGGQWVTVATPGGGQGLLAASAVAISPSGATGTDVARSAQRFSGLQYLWAGTSGLGFDCSGLTSAVYAAHGVVIPRDADDQAAAGTAVDRAHLQPGDLLFFATDNGRGEIHHVGMYVGNGSMVQSPATGRAVETVPVDQGGLADEYWGARRYLP